MNENERLGTQRLYALFERYPAVATDSRRAGEGTIFFALRGDRFDGNRFALAALDAGAACAVVDDPAVAASAGEAYAGRIVTVDDALAALQALACEHRRRLGIPLLAIVGSNGKTTTKELVSRVLAEKYAVYATQGNLNNHIGVPLTLLAMTRDTELGVVEMGASACGEIALLCAIAEPNFGLITNVGRAHLEGFGGVEGVRRGKGELYDYLAANGGRAFVRRDDGTLVKMAAERGNLAVEFYDPAIADGVGHRLEGAFNRLNVAAAMAVGRYFGVDEERIRDAVAAYRPDNNRSGDRRPAIRSSSIVTTPIRRVCRRRWPISSARSRSAARSPCWAICSNWGRGVRRSIVRRSNRRLRATWSSCGWWGRSSPPRGVRWGAATNGCVCSPRATKRPPRCRRRRLRASSCC